jgi:hypothetical protein
VRSLCRREQSHTAGSDCTMATTPELMEQVYRLRYSCYRRQGSIDPQLDEQFSDGFDQQPNSFSFLVARPTEAVATVRITVVKHEWGWSDSPVSHVYGDHVAFQEIAQDSFVEASRLCFGHQARRDTFIALVGNMAALASFYQTRWLIACPRVEHTLIYQRMFKFKPLAAPRRYFGVKFETQLLGIERQDFEHQISRANDDQEVWNTLLAQLKKQQLPNRTLQCA